MSLLSYSFLASLPEQYCCLKSHTDLFNNAAHSRIISSHSIKNPAFALHQAKEKATCHPQFEPLHSTHLDSAAVTRANELRCRLQMSHVHAIEVDVSVPYVLACAGQG